MATENPRFLVLLVVFEKNIKRICCFLILFMINADFSFGHEVAYRSLVLNIAERDIS